MCRFNLIMIKDEKAGEYLKSDDYCKIYDNLNGYMAYEKGSCNCGSFVGSLIDKKGMEYNAAIAARKKENLERLYQIKTLMNQPDYKERKEEFVQLRNKFSDELNVYFEAISEYELKRTDAIHNKFEGEDLEVQMGKLYEEVGNMISSLDEQPEYREKREAYANYLQENEIMKDSAIYYLTEDEEKEAETPGISLTDLLGPEINQKIEKLEAIEFKKESQVIDEVIDRTEKDTFNNNLEEFHTFYKLFNGLLKYVNSFLFATIWSEPGELKKVKTVSMDSIKIDDLAFLEFNEMICITK